MWLRVAVVVLGGWITGGPAQAAEPPTAHWIWAPGGEKENQTVFFRSEFEIHSAVKSARLIVASDNEAVVFVNGTQLLKNNDFNTPSSVDAGRNLKAGRNVVAVRGQNAGGPGGVILQLTVTTEDGVETFVSDASWKFSEKAGKGWQTADFDAGAWEPAVSVATVGNGPWTKVTADLLARMSKARPPAATPVDQLKIAKGFKVELLYSVPKEEEGSWVSMCTDPKGRLIVCDQYGGLYRVTPPPIGTPGEIGLEKLEVELGDAQGLLWAFDSLYVVVNSSGKHKSGVYRVRDTDGDDKLDSVEHLRELNGGGEHGPHAILPTPDGKSLYVVCGNQTKLTEIEQSLVPRIWSEDHLLPRMPDGRGFMAGVLAPGGCIYQIDPDGKSWKLISNGFRNQYDAAVNSAGELFTYDADMEWDVSTPWYRPTRVCHVVSGGEWGWRNGAGKYPVYYADTLPPAVNIGPGSPTGITFGYGAKFPAKYQNALFICDWSYGKLYAVHLTPQGGSYVGALEEFVTGTPLPLTDLVVNPLDGALYFAIGGRRVQSGLYRVTYTGAESTAPATTPAPPTPEQKLRRELEQWHGKADPKAVDAVWPHLKHPDRFVRWAARVALEHQPADSFAEKALAEMNPQAAMTALMALIRVSSRDEFHRQPEDSPVDPALTARILAALDRIEWTSLSLEQKQELLRDYTLVFTRRGAPDEATREKLIRKFDALYPAATKELNADLANLMAYFQAPSTAAKTVALLEAAPTQEEQIDLARAMRFVKPGWTPELRKTYLSWFLKAGTFTGGNSFGGFMKNIKTDAVATMTDEERTAFKDLIEATPETAAVAIAPPRPLVKEWKLEELTPLLETGLKDRSFDRGRTMFAAANCFSCHRFDNQGGAQGPDLTGSAGRFSARDLLESIVDPNKTISDQYAAVVISTVDGKVVTGRIINLNGDTFILNTNMLDPNAHTNVNRSEIDEMLESKVSMMPAGLLNTLNQDEFLDLMAYLLSRGDRNHPAFRKN